MSVLTVLKTFPHPIRRFYPGDEITELDLVGCKISIPDLKRGRFIAGAETKLAEVAVEKAEKADAIAALVPADPIVPEGATQLQVETAAVVQRDTVEKTKR